MNNDPKNNRMKTTFFLALILAPLLGGTAVAQPLPGGAPPEGEGISAASLRPLLFTLAGPAMEGRETGTQGQRRAAQWIAQQYRDWGIAGGYRGAYQQPYRLWQDTLQESLLEAGGRRFLFGRDYYCAVTENRNEALHVDSVAYAGYGIDDSAYSDYRGRDLRGKAVLVSLGEPRDADGHYLLGKGPAPGRWSRELAGRVKAAREHGAALLFIVSPQVENISPRVLARLRRSRVYLEKDSAVGPNYYFVSPAMGAALLGRPLPADPGRFLETGRRVSERFTKNVLSLEASNVMAYIPGTDKAGELVVVSAHYDHLGIQGGQLYPGADDDGSGTVAVMEIARAFAQAAQQGHRPRRSLLFLHVSGEEKGLLGSSYYTSHPVFPLNSTVADLNIDMIGRRDPLHPGDSPYVYIVGDDKLSSVMRPLSVAVNEQYTGLAFDYKYNDPADPERIYYRSDHYNFARHDIPIIFYFDGLHADYHRPGDTPDKIDYPLLARRARLVFHTAWALANREQPPPVDRHLP